MERQVFHLLIIGLDYLRTIQQADWLTDIRHISFVPLIVLSDTPEQDINNMVQLGADMCLSGKPPFAAIANHACAQLRRYTEYNHYDNPANTEAAPFQIGGIYIDPARRVAEVYGQPVTLRRHEFSLLLYFMRNHDVVLTPEQICEHAWRMEYTQSVGQSVHELRKQIEVTPNRPAISRPSIVLVTVSYYILTRFSETGTGKGCRPESGAAASFYSIKNILSQPQKRRQNDFCRHHQPGHPDPHLYRRPAKRRQQIRSFARLKNH